MCAKTLQARGASQLRRTTAQDHCANTLSCGKRAARCSRLQGQRAGPRNTRGKGCVQRVVFARCVARSPRQVFLGVCGSRCAEGLCKGTAPDQREVTAKFFGLRSSTRVRPASAAAHSARPLCDISRACRFSNSSSNKCVGHCARI